MKKMTQNEWIAVTVGLVIVVGVFYLFIPLRFFGTSFVPSFSGVDQASTVAQSVRESGLIVQDLNVGDGDTARGGKLLVVHYIGRLADGTEFDSSISRGIPFNFVLGRGEVIKGWDEGLEGMREGGRRILVIPPELGYGSTAIGSIPPNATLIFEVVLLEVRDEDS